MADTLINPNRMKNIMQKEHLEALRHSFSSAQEKRTSPSLLDSLTPPERKPSTEEIQFKILKIRSKLRSGRRLSPEDKVFLAKYAQDELRKLTQAERERDAFKARLQGCKTQEDMEHAFASASSTAGATEPTDPDYASVVVGQLSAAMRETGTKPTQAIVARIEEAAQLAANPDLEEAQRRAEELVRIKLNRLV